MRNPHASTATWRNPSHPLENSWVSNQLRRFLSPQHGLPLNTGHAVSRHPAVGSSGGFGCDCRVLAAIGQRLDRSGVRGVECCTLPQDHDQERFDLLVSLLGCGSMARDRPAPLGQAGHDQRLDSFGIPGHRQIWNHQGCISLHSAPIQMAKPGMKYATRIGFTRHGGRLGQNLVSRLRDCIFQHRGACEMMPPLCILL